MSSHPPSQSSPPAVAIRRAVVPLLVLATATMLPRLLTCHAGARLSWAGMLLALTGRHATLLQLVRHWPELMHDRGAAR